MTFFGLTPAEWILPLAIGIVAGLGTNAVAIWMLFHPYRPVRLAGVQVLPMGAIPKEIDRIARRIGEVVGRELLTSEDIAGRLASGDVRDRFDSVLREALESLIQREIGSLREVMTEEQLAGFQASLERILERLRDGLRIYLASPDWEARVHGFALSLGGELRERPLSAVLTPELHDDLISAAGEVWGALVESRELESALEEAARRAAENLSVSEKPLRSYVPHGAVNVGEAVVSQYLPILLERLGSVLEDPETRTRLQQALRRFVDRFLEEQRTWTRIVGRLVITERTLEQTVRSLEEGGIDELVAILRAPEMQTRIAAAVNAGVEETLDRPMRSFLENVEPERVERLTSAAVSRFLAMLRHTTTREVVIGRLDAFLSAAERRNVGQLFDLLGEGRAETLTARTADWFVASLRGERADALLGRVLARQTSWMTSVRIGKPADYLPADAAERAEALLFDPLWGFIQRRVPAAVTELPVARMVEDKLLSYPLQKVEELIWRVSKKELVLIIYLGGFLGALIGSLMLLTMSVPAGLTAAGVFLTLSFLFINLKGRARAAPAPPS
jgi:uncharacterized membrane protein YheB (UPF0754 family)